MAKLNKVRTKDTKFTCVFNQVIKDSTLSWKARGIFMYLWSLPDDWNFREIEIKNHSTDGKAALRTGLHELIKNHYLVIKTPVNSKNIKIGNSKWYLSDKRMSKDSDYRSPITGVRPSESDNRTLLSKDKQTTKEPSKDRRENRQQRQVDAFLNYFQKLFAEAPTTKFEHYMNQWIAKPYTPVRIKNVMDYAKRNCRTSNPNAIGSYMNGCLLHPMKPKKSNYSSKPKYHSRGDHDDSKYNHKARF